MSYPQSVPYVVVKEKTQYPQLFHKFAELVIESFIYDPRALIQRGVLAYNSLIPEELADDTYWQQLNELFGRFEEKQKADWEKYNKEVAEANCPDVIPKPSGVLPLDSPDGIDLRNIFHIARDLLFRRKLLLKKEVYDEI